MKMEEINPELFSSELYDRTGMWSLDDEIPVAESFGYCDAGRLPFRPRAGLFALMVECKNGNKWWFHVGKKTLEVVKHRIEEINRLRHREGGEE